MSRLRSLFSIVALLMAATTLMAVTPNSISYQGRATDAFDVPLNGGQSMVFTIFDAAVAGVSLWTSGAQPVTCVDGLFNVELGAPPMPALPVNIFDDSTRYLEVSVNGQVISPRTRLISAPYARNVARLQGAAGGAVSGNVDLQVSGTTRIDLETSGSRISTYSGSGGERARIWGPSWGELLLFDGSIANENTVMLDASTGSMFLRDAAGATTVTLSGEGIGNNAAILPNGAISSPEMFDEPGVASNYDASFAVPTNPANVTSRTITVPDDGYIVAHASTYALIVLNGGASYFVGMSISDVSATHEPNNFTTIGLPNSLAGGVYYFPMAVTAVIPVTAGAHTIYLVSDDAAIDISNATLTDSRLVLTYFPTSYGTVTTIPAVKPQTDSEEKAESIEQNKNRLADEVEKLRAQMANIEAQLKRQQAQTSDDNK
jgi:hypothetical protein